MNAADYTKKTLDVPTLQEMLQGVDPAVVLVSSRILERVIRDHYALPNMYWNIPHSRSFVCDRQDLFRHAEQADLELRPDQILPQTVILLLKPAAEELSSLEMPRLLLKYWRRLFHSRVHFALESGSTLNDDAIRERVEHIGRTEFEEIRAVLVEDRYLPPDPGERETFVEFAAVYLELRYFGQNLLRNFFPGIRDFGKIERLLARDVNAAELFVRTRLPHAPDPVMAPETRSDESQEAYWNLVRAATLAEQSGNIVRAAVIRMRASRIAPAAQTMPTRVQAEKNVAELTQRLATALYLGETETADWAKHLTMLLEKADQGTASRPTVEAAVLYELQNVCIAHDREVYVLDLVEWLTSMGKRPIKRPLPSQKLVRITKHLRAATNKLTEARLADAERAHLFRLMQSALHSSEERVRARFSPVLITAMEDVGLAPAGPIERAAFDKMVGELLDRIIEYGFLTFGELRDTISRNQLKLPDVSEPEDFLKGDALIRLDRRLASLLDGVYRPGEFYVRHLERANSLGFGTWWGRWVTRFVVGPFLLAWVLLFVLGLLLEEIDAHFLQYDPARASASATMHEVVRALMGSGYLPKGGAALAVEAPPAHDLSWLYWHAGAVLLAGFFLLAVLHNATFRQRLIDGSMASWRALKFVFWDVPWRFVPLETVKRLMSTWVFQLLYWYVLKPAFVTAILVLLIPPLWESWGLMTLLFFLFTALINSRVGRAASESVRDGVMALADKLRAGLLMGVVRFTLYVFKEVSEFIEYVLFSVDEYLRFRSGDSRLSLVVRTLLGVLWTPVAFFARFYMVVLIEPCLNPLKLPVSSIAAKVVYPLLIALSVQEKAIGTLTVVMPYWMAWLIVVPTIFFLPDAFGFLAWEMKENWKLYRSNRGEMLKPVVVGSHGETIRGLLQPGFHSGTVPQLFARLRDAEREAVRSRNWQKARQYRHEVEEVEAALGRFLVRDVVAVIKSSAAFRGEPVEAGGAHLATNRIHFEIVHAGHPDRPVEIEIEHNHYWIIAGLHSAGWLEFATPEQRRTFATCLAGAYKLADVDLVREQMLSAEGGPVAAARLTFDGVQVWREPHGEPVTYELRKRVGRPADVERQRRFVFARTPISWRLWLECWQQDSDGQGHAGLPGINELVLPMAEPPPERHELPTPEPFPVPRAEVRLEVSEGR